MQKIFTLLFLLVSLHTLAQKGKITGKIVSGPTGEPLIGATISIDTLRKSVVSDLNGVYTLANLSAGTYNITVSYVGYTPKEITEIVVKEDQVTSANITLDPVQRNTSTDVIVRTRVSRENVGALLAAQKNRASVSDGISAEIIRRTPDRNTGEVLKRVSGASIQDDRFAIIRGLNDRYNAALINGSPLPSSESDRKAFAFDIFPSNILDNLVIYKTATADMPGEFAGGLIDISTRAIPTENFTTVSIGGGYNLVTTFKEKLDYKGGKLDFLGIDDGARKLPDAIKNAGDLSLLTNEQRAALARTLPNNWGLTSGKFSPNYNLQILKGLTVQRRGDDFLGVLLSLTYNKSSNFTEGERKSFEYDRSSPGAPPVLRGDYKENGYNDQTLLGGLANFSLKLNSRNTLNWKNIYSINSSDRVIDRNGFQDATNDPLRISNESIYWFTSNRIYSTQLSGDHVLNQSNLRLNWTGSYATVSRTIPNLRQSVYLGFTGSPDVEAFIAEGRNSLIPNNSGTMFFSNTDENIYNGRFDFTQPFNFKATRNQLKAGFYYQKRDRQFDANLYGLGAISSNFDRSIINQPVETIFANENIGRLPNGQDGLYLLEYRRPSYVYTASSGLTAGYLMMDQRYKKLRAIYGLRLENFNQKLNSTNENNIPVNVDVTKLDLLPSFNLVYALTSKQNLRASYSRTVNRPEFRELAPFVFYDFVTRYTVEGLDSLQRASINNYDIRYEIYPGRSQLFSVSVFYKDFTNPIELVASPVLLKQALYQNARSAKVYGLEAEARVLLSTLFKGAQGSLIDRLTLSVNAAFVKSEIVLNDFAGVISVKDLIEKRNLQGQSPYVFNASLAYSDDKGWSSTLSANRVGQRIFIVGTVSEADIYENGRTVVDFQVAKSIKDGKWELRLNLKDLLAQKQIFFYDFNNDRKYNSPDGIFSSNRIGSVISASVAYKF